VQSVPLRLRVVAVAEDVGERLLLRVVHTVAVGLVGVPDLVAGVAGVDQAVRGKRVNDRLPCLRMGLVEPCKLAVA
jgi:hypothetical protein